MSTVALDADSQAIALLCSSLGLPRGSAVTPLTPREWTSLTGRIRELADRLVTTTTPDPQLDPHPEPDPGTAPQEDTG